MAAVPSNGNPEVCARRFVESQKSVFDGQKDRQRRDRFRDRRPAEGPLRIAVTGDEPVRTDHGRRGMLCAPAIDGGQRGNQSVVHRLKC
jgi:hypothetical protein